MFFIKALGWVLIGTALLMASGEAIAALGTGTHDYIAAADLWALFLGSLPDFGEAAFGLSWDNVWMTLLGWPAWAIFAPLGGMLLLAVHLRPRRKRMFAGRNPRHA